MNALRALVPLLMFVTVGARAVEPGAPDTGHWSCKFCTFENGTEGWIEPAIGTLSASSFHFGDYRGLDDRGLLLDLGGAWRYRDADTAQRVDVRMDHLGLDARAVSVRIAQQGRHTATLEYDVIPHLRSREARTPFDASGNLPAGWSPASSTGAMTDLAASLHGVPLAQKRERLALGASWQPGATADLRFDYHRDAITGTGSTGGSFLTLASQLPKSLDQVTDRLEATAAYRNELGQMSFGLASSFFFNSADALAWQSPYLPMTPGADRGQLALAPDNRAHRLSATYSAPPAQALQLTARIAYGRLLQNQRFAPATLNPNEAVALPRDTLDGRVDTTLATLRAGYRLSPTLRLSADVLHDERSNKTPVTAWTQVVMDTFTGGSRVNVPYGFTRERWRVQMDQSRAAHLALGVEQDTRLRQLARRYDTTERTAWGRVSLRLAQGMSLRTRVAHAERDGSRPFVSAGAVPAQNPLLQPFQLADRSRDELRADLSASRGPVAGALNLSAVHNRYRGTLLGRTKDRAVGYGAEGSAQLLDSLSISVFAQRQVLSSTQAGSESFAAPDWLADQNDDSSAMGLHAEWKAPHDIDVGGDYTLATSNGALVVTTAALDTAFPGVATRWHDARLFARYPLRPNLSLRVDLEREIYDASDWALDGVAPATIPGELALGQGTRAGNVTAILLSLRYRL